MCKSFSVLFVFYLARMNISLYLRSMKQELLKQEVERILGHKLSKAADFEQLSHLLFIIANVREVITYNPKTLLGIPEKRGSADQATHAGCVGAICGLSRL